MRNGSVSGKYIPRPRINLWESRTRKQIQEERQRELHSDFSASSEVITQVKEGPSPSPEQNNVCLPPGWSTAISKSTGKTYYFNIHDMTGATQWEPPSPPSETKTSSNSIHLPESETEIKVDCPDVSLNASPSQDKPTIPEKIPVVCPYPPPLSTASDEVHMGENTVKWPKYLIIQ